MPSTYRALHYHIVFSTKDRFPFIQPLWRSRFYKYIGGAIHGLGGHAHCIGGTADHVHILVELRSTHRLADFMRDLKRLSSKWIHQEIGIPGFARQEGYAAFTVGRSGFDKARRYIDNQEAHHRTRSFREEIVQMLESARIVYDPKYLD